MNIEKYQWYKVDAVSPPENTPVLVYGEYGDLDVGYWIEREWVMQYGNREIFPTYWMLIDIPTPTKETLRNF